MPIPFYDTSEVDINSVLAALGRRKCTAQGLLRDGDSRLNEEVEEIVRDVEKHGDEALVRYTEKFDGVSLKPRQIRVSRQEILTAFASIPPRLRDALQTAAERIRRFQASVLLSDPPVLEDGGRRLSLRYLPVEAAGICVPGASASLASSVLMNVIPAVSAGVRRIVMITPPGKDGTVSADRLAAAHIAGANEVYRVFGPQAVAALAFGTGTIEPVDFIAGPGNAYVAAAKKTVFGKVGIDMIAGPSEVAVAADETAHPDRAAAELLAQAEHTDGNAVLLTNCPATAKNTMAEFERQGASLPDWQDIKRRMQQYGCVILCRSFDECFDICNKMAPEHLVIMSDDADGAVAKVRHAGAVFLGHHTPVAVGDYVAGPSHTLPTGTTARFASGLTANHFLKSSSIIRFTKEALEEDSETVRTIAGAEGLAAHARSVTGNAACGSGAPERP